MTTITTTNQSSASNIAISDSSYALQVMDLEFDFELCHTQYSYCSCWH
jgi:hypothetical protein